MSLITQIIKLGDGKNFPKKGDLVTVHYIGSVGGKIFDSTKERDEPFSFKLGAGEVIKGWEEAIPLLSNGQIAVLEIPPELAYGEKGLPGIIESNATLNFEVELISFK